MFMASAISLGWDKAQHPEDAAGLLGSRLPGHIMKKIISDTKENYWVHKIPFLELELENKHAGSIVDIKINVFKTPVISSS